MEKCFDNQNNYYPIVLLPLKIKDALLLGIDDNIILSKIELKKPQLRTIVKPSFPSKIYYVHTKEKKLRFDFVSFSMFVIILILIGAIALKSIFYLFWIFPLLIATHIFMGDRLIYFEDIHNQILKTKDEKEYNDLYSKYLENLNLYNSNIIKNKEEFERELLEFKKQITIKKKEISLGIFLEYLKPEIKSSRINNSKVRGKQELNFLQVLLDSFPNMIFMDKAPLNKFGSPIFFPDFTFVCEKTNLHFDIEIDEPYSMENKMPIHYTQINNHIDENRNNYFLEINWVVIRFSEKQIVQSPLQCIETISSIYDAIINSKNTYKCFVDIDKAWTYEEALVKANNNERSRYIN